MRQSCAAVDHLLEPQVPRSYLFTHDIITAKSTANTVSNLRLILGRIQRRTLSQESRACVSNQATALRELSSPALCGWQAEHRAVPTLKSGAENLLSEGALDYGLSPEAARNVVLYETAQCSRNPKTL